MNILPNSEWNFEMYIIIRTENIYCRRLYPWKDLCVNNDLTKNLTVKFIWEELRGSEGDRKNE